MAPTKLPTFTVSRADRGISYGTTKSERLHMTKSERLTKAMVFGSAAWDDEEKKFYLSSVGLQRAERLARLYHSDGFDARRGQILITGGYGARLADAPPCREQREGALMAAYIMREYNVPSSRLLVEDGSTNTIENWKNSLGEFPNFFEGCRLGQETLALVSHPNHLVRVRYIGEQLGLCASRLLAVATDAFDNPQCEQEAFERTKNNLSMMRVDAA